MSYLLAKGVSDTIGSELVHLRPKAVAVGLVKISKHSAPEDVACELWP